MWRCSLELFLPFASWSQKHWSCLCPSEIWIYSSSCIFTFSTTVTHPHSSQVLSLLLTLHPLFCIATIGTIQLRWNWRLSWANSTFTAEPTWGWNPSLCNPFQQQQKCSTQVLKLIWNTGCWLLVPVSLFFKGWALYLYCLREQTRLHKKLHSSRIINCCG